MQSLKECIVGAGRILPPSAQPRSLSGKWVAEWNPSVVLAQADPSSSYFLLGTLRSKQSIYPRVYVSGFPKPVTLECDGK